MSLSIAEVAKQTGLSESAVRALHEALVRGRGNAAQFNHPELGGMGQWMRGGMVMIGDMFNSALAARVSQACALLSDTAAAESLKAPLPSHANWWPADLGDASMSASQNDIDYAYFPSTGRLAVRTNGTVAVYDVGQERVGGLSAQSGTLTVHTDRGTRALSEFKRIGS